MTKKETSETLKELHTFWLNPDAPEPNNEKILMALQSAINFLDKPAL